MLKTILGYGTIAGLVAGVPLTVMTLSMSGGQMMEWGMLVGYATMLLAFTTIFIAIKQRRDGPCGGTIRFWPAFGLGLGIAFVAGLFYVAAWEIGSGLSGSDFAATYADAMIAQRKAAGVSGQALARYAAEMADFRRSYANPLWRLPMTFAEIFPVGVLVSLVAAALLRNSRFLPART
ncbi:MAG: DUF4199 domain-containing protein [Alphaproteobacteria bacterium]|nr:DUF4199 domain-containing protein [Alphaproteobacteria bacterium]MBV9372491.1 DUF4199 domain-containing protein [Alphaproteobacteria bacterium]MBV9902166.1 DUF4199 domain-containing protein [Alphaproteobacteria bacterium]